MFQKHKGECFSSINAVILAAQKFVWQWKLANKWEELAVFGGVVKYTVDTF